ncbi:MAG: DUF2971 domain-containing protein [Sediminibacterium magnilacihabitans]|jgi:hypothetical protein|nr:DUF2971 domain-containing protein [Sediminibacterium magnilacihabitans]PQV59443.1 hypothetical protein CLV53_1184 [Sediminibacterium magnilacihabitans]
MNNDLIQDIEKLGYKLISEASGNEEHEKKNQLPHRYFYIPQNNGHLANTDFFLNEQIEFVHFTSLDCLDSILKTGTLRMTSLASMDDKLEMTYPMNELGFPLTEKWIKGKSEIYCLSMCCCSEVENNKTTEHLLWKLYGKDGNGAYIKLRFENRISDWVQYHLSRVYYSTERVSAVKRVHQKMSDAIELDPKICCFFKNKIYEFENEVRLLFDCRREGTSTYTVTRAGKLLFPIIHSRLDSQKFGSTYVDLPLLNFHETSGVFWDIHNPTFVNGRFPETRMIEIVLGYRHEPAKLETLNSIYNRFGIQVSLTKLAEYF